MAFYTVRKDGPLWPALPLAAAAIAGDLLLRHNILRVEAEYFQATGIWARIWLLFWFGWQIGRAAAVATGCGIDAPPPRRQCDRSQVAPRLQGITRRGAEKRASGWRGLA